MKTPSVINAPKVIPSVSLIIPTDKSYPQYKINEEKLKSLLKDVEIELLNDFSENETKQVITKLYKLTASVNHKHLLRGLAIYASAERENVFYLPFQVKEKIIIDASFEVRDLLYGAKNSIDYMVLLLNSNKPVIYYGYNNILVKTTSIELPLPEESIEGDHSLGHSNFLDTSAIKETNLDKYLRETDRILTNALKQIPVPIIVSGPKKSIGHFKSITRNSKHIMDYVEGNYSAFRLKRDGHCG